MDTAPVDTGQGGRGSSHDFDRPLLDAVRSLGAATTVDGVLQQICDDVVGTLGFRAATLNVRERDGNIRVRAVAGPSPLAALLHVSVDGGRWEELLSLCVRRDGVYVVDSSEASSAALKAVEQWFGEGLPRVPISVWRPENTAFVPLRDGRGELTGVLSANLPNATSDPARLAALTAFAAQAQRSIHEVGVRERAESRRREAERRLELVWRSGLIATGVLDGDGFVLDVNHAAAANLGWRRDELVGRHFLDVIPTERHAGAVALFEFLRHSDGAETENLLQRRDGSRINIVMYAASVVEGEPARRVLVFQWVDVTDRRRAEAQSVYELRHDVLTGLGNRRALDDALAEWFDQERTYAMLSIDIDGFRSVAEGLGAAAGNALLVDFAARLAAVTPDDAVLARLEGDHFGVGLPGADVRDAVALAEAIMSGLDEPFQVAGEPHVVRTSIGVSQLRSWHGHPADARREAIQAARRAKLRGRGRVQAFDPGRDRVSTRDDLALEHALRRAIDSDTQLEAHFQSVISLTTGATVGHEALLRWRLPGHGVLTAERFMPVAARVGLVAPLGWRTLDLLQQVVSGHAGNKLGSTWIAVNLSASQLGRGILVPAVRRLLDGPLGDDPSRLWFEITEGSLLGSAADTIDELYAIVALGTKLAMDNFGAGYSSLTLLRDLPVSAVKIDRSFVTPIDVDVRARSIVEHTIELCRGLGAATIAEGIETQQQLAWLQTLGCEYGQGFFIDRPQPWPDGPPGSVPTEPPRRFDA